MNTSDLVCNWEESEMDQFMDIELKMDAKLYGDEIKTEWNQLEPIFNEFPDIFPGYTKELFLEMYNYACTRVFGWTLPNTMMVPMADFQNHLPVDTQYDCYSKDHHLSKQSINSAKTEENKGNLKVDFSGMYTK